MLTERGLDWVLNGVGATVMVVGIILVLWALHADRARGRKRCPKCWYDLSASPEMRCSECGFVARTERKLRKTRRHWRRCLFGLFVIAVGSAGPGYRMYREDWQALVPTTLLIYLMPDLERDHAKLYDSLEQRMDDSQLWGWQWEWLLDRCLDEDNLPIYLEVKTRQRWPEGVDVHYELRARFGFHSSWLSSSDVEFRVLDEDIPILELGWNMLPSRSPTSTESMPSLAIRQMRPPADASSVTVRFDQELGIRYVPLRIVFRGSPIPPPPRLASTPPKMIRSIPTELSVSVGGAVDDVIEPVQDSLIEAALRRRTHLTEDHQVIVGMPGDVVPAGMALAIIVEVLWDDVIVLSDRWIIPRGTVSLGTAALDGYDDSQASRWTVRIRGDGELALQDFDATSYWAGDITFPVQKAAPGRLSE